MLKRKKDKNNYLQMILILALWFLFVLYPNPLKLANSVQRLINPPVTPAAVSAIASELVEFSNPMRLRITSMQHYPTATIGETYGMPWYFPTLEEALLRGEGDCKSRYLLFASLMEELDIPYEKRVSFTHIWVNHEGKPDTALENELETLFVVDECGEHFIQLPRPDWQRSLRSLYRGFWEVMPGERKLLLLAGLPIIYGLFNLPQPLMKLVSDASQTVEASREGSKKTL